jgi:Cytochrome c oxidase subunit IV
MRIEARLFEIIAAFFVFAAVVYGGMTAASTGHQEWTGTVGGEEWAGTTALALTGGLAMIIATFFRFVARRLETRPEDYEGAEISDGAGELGFFAPHSWWPILVALAASVAAVGVAIWLPWLIVAGVVFVLASAAGLVFEYYVGPEKH